MVSPQLVTARGYNLFDQIPSNPYESLSKVFNLELDRRIVSVTFSWCTCYVVLDNGHLYGKGVVGRKTQGVLKIPDPQEGDFITKVSCMRDNQPVCLTKSGKCYKLCKDFTWEEVVYPPDLEERKVLKIVDICANDNTECLFVTDQGQLFNFTRGIDINPRYKVKKVACGYEHYMCLTKDGIVFVWGNGRRGQLGLGNLKTYVTPQLLHIVFGTPTVDIACGGWHSAAVTVLGEAFLWGWNGSGQIGISSKVEDDKEIPYCNVVDTPQPPSYDSEKPPDVAMISCGSRHTMLVSTCGSLWGCGWNKYKQICNQVGKKEMYSMTRIENQKDTQFTVTKVECANWNTAVHVANCQYNTRKKLQPNQD